MRASYSVIFSKPRCLNLNRRKPLSSQTGLCADAHSSRVGELHTYDGNPPHRCPPASHPPLPGLHTRSRANLGGRPPPLPQAVRDVAMPRTAHVMRVSLRTHDMYWRPPTRSLTLPRSTHSTTSAAASSPTSHPPPSFPTPPDSGAAPAPPSRSARLSASSGASPSAPWCTSPGHTRCSARTGS